MMERVKSGGRWAFTLVALFFFHLPSGASLMETRPATVTTVEMRQRLFESHAKIHAWYIVYESPREATADQPGGPYLHRAVAAKAPDRFFHWNSHGSASLDWSEDPYQQRLVLNSRKGVSEWPSRRSFRLLKWTPDESLPGTASNEFLFPALGWWPLDKTPPPTADGDVPIVVPAIARSSRYSVNPRQELVHGRWCHVFEYPGRDKIWLDCDRNCVILARELYDHNSGLVIERIESSAHREVQPGIWVPFEFRNELFDPAIRNSRGGEGRRILNSSLRVLEARLNNQVGEDVFRFQPLPGGIQADESGSIVREVPGFAHYLKEVVDRIHHRRFQVLRGSDPDNEAIVEYSIIACGVGMMIVFYCRRKVMRRE